MKTMILLATAAAAIVAAPATAATSFVVDSTKTFANVTGNRGICVLRCSVTGRAASIDAFSLNAGESRTFDFATFTFNGFLGFAEADIVGQLAFANPFAVEANADATTGYVRGFLSTTGLLRWDNPLQEFTGADGTKFSVRLDNVAGLTLRNTYTARATVSLLAAAVPEPATWAMMLVGFGMVAGAARYRRRTTNVTYA